MLKKGDVCHWKVKTGVFQFVDAFPPDPRCPLENEMSLHTYTSYIKGVLGLGGWG